MTRHAYLFLFLVPFLIAAEPVFAGKATYVDMRGKWESTQCTPPEAMTRPAHNPEMAANDLNALVMRHNQFTADAKVYMDCLSEEAKKDAQAMSYLATETANKMISDVMAALEASSLQVQKAQN